MLDLIKVLDNTKFDPTKFKAMKIVWMPNDVTSLQLHGLNLGQSLKLQIKTQNPDLKCRLKTLHLQQNQHYKVISI
jgi:hypothetical protein